MEQSKAYLKEADVTPYLQLGMKLEDGGTKSTGPHRVKLVGDKVFDGKDFMGKDCKKMRYIVEEGGIKKKYDTNLLNPQGELSYLVQKLADFEEGTEVILEYRKNGAKGFINVSAVGTGDGDPGSTEDMPVIDTASEGYEAAGATDAPPVISTPATTPEI